MIILYISIGYVLFRTDYLLEARFGDKVHCTRCGHKTVYAKSGYRWDCAACGYRMSLTSGTIMHGTRKPLKWWFRAIWEVCVHRQGISAKDLQRLMGFGSYETAWAWLHKIRRLMVDPDRQVLDKNTELDESFMRCGRKNEEGLARGKPLVLIGIETKGRIRLAHAGNNDEAHIKAFVEQSIGDQVTVTTDGLASYNSRTLGKRKHKQTVQYQGYKDTADPLQHVHWAASNLKRWILATHGGAVSAKHLQAYLDEFCFRHNRRKTKGVGRLVARTIQNIGKVQHFSLKSIINTTRHCRNFAIGN